MKGSLAAINLLLGATVLAWPLGLFMTAFLFDAPGSTASVLTWALALSILLYPMPVLAGNVLFWRQRTRASVKRLTAYTALTLSGPLLIPVAYLALDLVCDGRFACN